MVPGVGVCGARHGDQGRGIAGLHLQFCHFLAPAIFPLVDNAAMGNPFPTYEACFAAYRAEWLATDEVILQALVSRLARLIDTPLAEGYPTKNKVVELCLIGRNHG